MIRVYFKEMLHRTIIGGGIVQKNVCDQNIKHNRDIAE